MGPDGIDFEDTGTNHRFKHEVKEYYFVKLNEDFDIDNVCSWCSNCRCVSLR